jgi:hypothetical protein
MRGTDGFNIDDFIPAPLSVGVSILKHCLKIGVHNINALSSTPIYSFLVI